MAELITLDLSSARVSDYLQRKILNEWSDDFIAEHGFPPIAGGASFSDYLENKVLDHIFNDGTFAVPTASLGLWTSALTDASTGATAGELTYTTYARVTIAAADMSAAASGSKTNTAAFTFPACTAGGGTVTFWGTFDSATIGAGNLLVWGTATSTVISTTQTPPVVAIGQLVVTLD
jgi:hypothetical protein